MKRTLRLVGYVSVLVLATVVVYAGPCEDSCEFNKTQCNNQALQTHAGCVALHEEDRAVCERQARLDHADCEKNRPFDACNFQLEVALQGCENVFNNNKQQCDWTQWMDQASCNNDYENCLFACSVQ